MFRKFADMSDQLKMSAICSVFAMAAFAITAPDTAAGGGQSLFAAPPVNAAAGTDDLSAPAFTLPNLPFAD